MRTTNHTIAQRKSSMPIGKIGQRRQVVIPQDICEDLGLAVGDYVEVQRVKGTVVITPKKVVDVDEVLTPEQKAYIDARLAEGMEDMRAGRVHGPFTSVEALHASLHRGTSKRNAKRTASS
jgi:AbrB family looped-hinge helix DNA binding protein